MQNTIKVLVVEDETVIALNLEDKLKGLGYGVAGTAASGEAAVALALEKRPDVVLMDINLEGEMDGIEAAQRIRAAAPIPVVFLTAYAGDETLKRAEASTPYGYLVKPTEVSELGATLRMALARRQAEVAVERSEERQRLALGAARLGIWEWESDSGNITTAGHVHAIGGSLAQPVGEDWASFLTRVHPADRATLDGAVMATLVRNLPLNVAFRSLSHDDGERWCELDARVFATATGAPERVVGVVKDITARREAEERLWQAAVILETTAGGMFLMDRDHHIVAVNPAFQAITGYLSEEVLGQDPEKMLHVHHHSDKFYPELQNMGQWQGEISCRRKNGEIFLAWESMSVVRDEAGQVTHYVAAFSDISAIRTSEAKLQRMAHHDSLTGLPNRLLFNDRLEQALSRAARDGHRLALLFLDLDGFKTINDTLGHVSGDLLLKTAAERIRGAIRRSDTAARLGGDEFVVLMQDIDGAEDAARLAEKLLGVIGLPVALTGHRIEVSTSVGVSLYPEDGGDRHALVKAADAAMYAAKAQGRNRYAFYTEALSARAAERLAIEQGLRQAVKARDLSVHYQPLIGLADGALSGVEALVRWQNAKEGPIAPGRFIPIAEDSGLIEALGHFVIETACREVLAFPAPLRLAVNISVRQLTRNRFEDTLAAVLEATGFPAERLELEITESTLQALEENREVLGRIKSLGVGIAVDDFGTGYSSLSVLKHLPIDRLKIDQSFVRDIPADANDVAIVAAICALGLSLGIRITAEGIETREQLELLRQLGCHEGQGYLFSRPLPAEGLFTLAGGGRPWAGFGSD